MDTRGGSSNTSLLEVSMKEDSQPYISWNQFVPMDVLAKSWGWTPVTISGTTEPRYFSTDNWGIDLGRYTIIVDPCYAKGTC